MSVIKTVRQQQRWKAAGHSHAGGRPYNEDSFDMIGAMSNRGRPLCIGVVADGVGGENAGAWASHTASAFVKRYMADHAASLSVPELLRRALHEANHELLRQIDANPQRQGAATTLVVAAIEADRLFLSHLGDSRAYLIRQGRAHQLTLDHSVVQEEYDAGVISLTEMPTHEEAHTITRFLGDETSLAPDSGILDPHQHQANLVDTAERNILRSFDLVQGDTILLCTDGLTDVVDPQTIARIADRYAAPAEKAEALVQHARRNRTPDNVTVVALTTTLTVGSGNSIRSRVISIALVCLVAAALIYGQAIGAFADLQHALTSLVGTQPSMELDRAVLPQATHTATPNRVVNSTTAPSGTHVVLEPTTNASVPRVPTKAALAILPTRADTPTPTSTPSPTATATLAPIATSSLSALPESGSVVGLDSDELHLADVATQPATKGFAVTPTSTAITATIPLTMTYNVELNEPSVDGRGQVTFEWSTSALPPDGEYFNVIIFDESADKPARTQDCWYSAQLAKTARAISNGTKETTLEAPLRKIIDEIIEREGRAGINENTLRGENTDYWWAVALFESDATTPKCILSELRHIVVPR